MLQAVITTIQEPTESVLVLVEHLNQYGGGLTVAGDVKGPQAYEPPTPRVWPLTFLSIDNQRTSQFELAETLPTKHYARKNLAYLHAISHGATCIYETDDDNAPNESWRPREEFISNTRLVPQGNRRWINVYRYFTDEYIWPRGLPLNEIQSSVPEISISSKIIRAPIQQGLVDGSPDVDAIWRLVFDRPFTYNKSPSVGLMKGNWCPFNTQTTWWWPLAYPLLYIPSYCSFRMCDIWKSFVAQRCIWELDLGVVFHAPEVFQNRNPHNLMHDFHDEIPGYEQNRKLCNLLENLELSNKESDVALNLIRCYEHLVGAGIFPEKELNLVKAWNNDLNRI